MVLRGKIRFASTTLSLAALLSTGCMSKQYSQVQIGYANTGQERMDRIDLLCIRTREGAKVGEEKKEEFRLGFDVCYGKLPDSSSHKTYTIEVPLAGTQQIDVEGTTRSKLVKLSVPFIEYQYGQLEANIPGQAIAKSGLRSSETKDLSLGMWATMGYNIDFIISQTDYDLGGGSLDHIPGINVNGKFYGELTNEITLFGKVPLDISVRVDDNGKVMPLFLGGYRIQW